jgi:hypothetical protein
MRGQFRLPTVFSFKIIDLGQKQGFVGHFFENFSRALNGVAHNLLYSYIVLQYLKSLHIEEKQDNMTHKPSKAPYLLTFL